MGHSVRTVPVLVLFVPLVASVQQMFLRVTIFDCSRLVQKVYLVRLGIIFVLVQIRSVQSKGSVSASIWIFFWFRSSAFQVDRLSASTAVVRWFHLVTICISFSGEDVTIGIVSKIWCSVHPVFQSRLIPRFVGRRKDVLCWLILFWFLQICGLASFVLDCRIYLILFLSWFCIGVLLANYWWTPVAGEGSLSRLDSSGVEISFIWWSTSTRLKSCSCGY